MGSDEEEVSGTNSRAFRRVAGAPYSEVASLLKDELRKLQASGHITADCCSALTRQISGLAVNIAASQFLHVLGAFVFGQTKSTWRLPNLPVLKPEVASLFESLRRRSYSRDRA